MFLHHTKGANGSVEKSRQILRCQLSTDAARFQILVGSQPHTLWYDANPRVQRPSTRHAILGVGRVWMRGILINHISKIIPQNLSDHDVLAGTGCVGDGGGRTRTLAAWAERRR
jgi:hypothetical protein